MTSEVVVMNSLAVALAADSAATVSSGRDNKIYNSADKLFMLSRHHPVGVMVYNNSALLGVPWETILKMFRRTLGPKEFPRLTDYGAELLRFLNQHRGLFPEALQQEFYLRLVSSIFERLAKRIEKALLRELMQKVGDSDNAQRSAIAGQIILAERDRLSELADVACYPASTGPKMAGRFSGEIHRIALRLFQDFNLDVTASQALHHIAGFLITKDEISADALTGVVIAGFGADEHFPVMQSFQFGEVYLNQLKVRQGKIRSIDQNTPSIVVPFAQSDMVNTFLHGMNPAFEFRLVTELLSLVVNMPGQVIDAISHLTDEQKELWKRVMAPAASEAGQQFLDRLSAYRNQQHFDPIRQAIAHLPKDELAHVAASLVNLNVFQKRMSRGPETVGGPIDVAVISKGDGFVWIERKHYFRPELNHHFFRNYFPQLPPEGTHDIQHARSDDRFDAGNDRG